MARPLPAHPSIQRRNQGASADTKQSMGVLLNRN
jgi:hypothetical protein